MNQPTIELQGINLQPQTQEEARANVQKILLQMVDTIHEDAGPNRDKLGFIQIFWNAIIDPQSIEWLGHKPGAHRGNEWCAAFACWVLQMAGIPMIHRVPKQKPEVLQMAGLSEQPTWGNGYYGCGMMLHWLRNKGLFFDNKTEPEPGDIIFFDWAKIAAKMPEDTPVHWKRAATDVDHVGFVESVGPDGIIHTIEGNWSGGIKRADRKPDVIVGYGDLWTPNSCSEWLSRL